jgi:cyclopropane fatty-acyl-phospholipid synthase-like methyltransferase
VQKVVTDEWRAEMNELYSGYSMYEQGGGSEQVSFDTDSGAGTARSKKVVDWLIRTGSLPKEGTLLDVGCGNGAFMRSFGGKRPDWKMNGLELDARNRALVTAIPGVEELHVGTIESLQSRFDMISLIHALEHMPDPVGYLREIRGRLNEGGMVLIEVPDLDKSRFDILVADHCTHFRTTTLRNALCKAGFEVMHVEAGVVSKELTLLARPAPFMDHAEKATSDKEGEVAAQAHITWLQNVLAQGRATRPPFGIFGTSISATWLAAALGDNVKFFVDEDANRIGRRHMGLPIHGPENAPRDFPVLMPLHADVATSVCARLLHTHIQLVRPPAG